MSPSALILLLLLFATLNVPAVGQAPSGTSARLDTTVNRPKGMSELPSGMPIQYVIVIMQENRSTDNLFHGLPNADIANSGYNSKGQKITLTSIPLQEDYDPVHEHPDWVAMYDGGKMDGADKVRIRCGPHAQHCPPPNAQFKYVRPTQVAPYFKMAETYTFADRNFQTNQGPSFGAHQIIISGTAAPDPTSLLFASETPNGGAAGCDLAANVWVQMIDPLGRENLLRFPCFEHETMPDLLDSKQISWRYYAETARSLWNGPNSIYHLRFGQDWQDDVIGPSKVLSDIAHGELASVSWVTPTHAESDHPDANNGTGPSWVSSIVNAIGSSQYWANTAIFITWDDWGGWYDHVAPNIINSYEYGFRVPLVVVSPYAKPGYVSHVTHDFSSILKFMEKVYGLPSLGFGDERADDLMDCFNFSQKPLTFHRIAAPHDAHYFLSRKRQVPVGPGDDDD